MDPPGLGIYRRRTLTNSAAEFVETGAGMEVVAQIIDSEDMEEVQAASEFVPELDQFVPKGVIVEIEKCYEASKQRMVKFQKTLESFVRLLRERNVDKELNVEIKDVGQLTMEDALAIIGKIQDGRNTKQVKSCKDFIYKCYRKAENKRGIAEAVLTMIPNDAYGSVISGGFTLILAAVEKHVEHRNDMQNFLSEIPEQLERLHRLSQLHLNSLRVHGQRDAVLVSIFSVLERIVDHLTQSWRGKVKSKVKVIFGNSKSKSSTDLVTTTGETGSRTDTSESKQTVADALIDFRNQVDLFQEEVDIANSERLGRVENTSTFLQDGIVAIAKELRNNRAELEQNRSWIENFVKGTCAASNNNRIGESSKDSDNKSQKELIHVFYTTFYQFLASNPTFDPKTGQLNLHEMSREEQRRRIKQGLIGGTPSSFEQSNREISTRWLDRLQSRTGLTTYDFLQDANAVLISQHRLDPDEIDQCNYISWTSPEYKSWLKIERAGMPSLLTIDLQTPPGIHNPINALSFITVRTAIAFRMQQGPHKTEEMKPHSPKWPVLAFFCRQRNMASRNVNVSGAPALVRSLCAQLLEWIALFRPEIDLETTIKTKDFFRGARKDIDDALRMFRALLVILRDAHEKQNQERVQEAHANPQVQPVWILIEGLSCLTVAHSTSESHNMIAALWHIIEEVSRPPRRNGSGRNDGAPCLAIKLLVTDAFGNSPINRVDGTGIYILHVPDTPTMAGSIRGVLDGGDAAREFSRLVDRPLAGGSSGQEGGAGSGGGGSGKQSRKKGNGKKVRSRARVQIQSGSGKSSSEQEEEEESSSGTEHSTKGKQVMWKGEGGKKKSAKRKEKLKKKGKKVESGSQSDCESTGEDEQGERESEGERGSEDVSSVSESSSAVGTEREASQKGKAKRRVRKVRSRGEAKKDVELGSPEEDD